MKYYNSYSEVVKDKRFKTRVRDYARDIVLNKLSAKSIDDISNTSDSPRIQFIYFHHLFSDEEKNLEIFIRKISEIYEFLSYSDGVDKILNGNIDRPYIVFSSDDGLKNNLRAGEILSKYGIEACFFVNPSMVGEADYDTVKTFCKKKLDFPPVDFLDWNEINRLQEWGHEIGSHTMSHINVAESHTATLEDELVRSHTVLTKKCGPIKHFAFPFGRFQYFSEEGRRAVFAAGYDSCASGERGCHINHGSNLSKEQLCIRRDHVIFDWELDHILYFLAKNAWNATTETNLFPYS